MMMVFFYFTDKLFACVQAIHIGCWTDRLLLDNARKNRHYTVNSKTSKNDYL